jgi:hypothetical protein
MNRSTAAAIDREGWASISVKVPPQMAKEYAKAMIDADCNKTQPILSFINSVILGEISVEIRGSAARTDDRRRHYIMDDTGVFDDFRVRLKLPGGQLINPLPIPNKFLK